MLNQAFTHYKLSFSNFSQATLLTVTAVFFSAMSYMVVVFLPIYLTINLHFSIQAVAIILASYGVGQLLGAFLGGLLCDWINAKLVSMASLFLRMITAVCLILITSYTGLIIAIAVLGIADGIFRPAINISLLANCRVADRLRVSGLYRLALNMGAGCSVILGGIISLAQYQTIFTIAIIFNLSAVAILLLSGNDLSSTSPVENPKNNSKVDSAAASAIWRDYIFWGVAFILFFNGFAYAQTTSTLPIYLTTNLGFSGYGFGNLFFINSLLIIVFEVPLLAFLSQYNQLHVAMLGTLLIALGLGILALGANLVLVILSFIIWTFGEILSFATILTLLYNHATAANRGRYLGAYHAVLAMVSIVSPLLGGWLYLFYHGKLLWVCCAAVGISSVFIFLILAYCVKSRRL